MVYVLTSSAVDHGFDPGPGQTNDCAIGIGYFSAKHTTLGERAKTGCP